MSVGAFTAESLPNFDRRYHLCLWSGGQKLSASHPAPAGFVMAMTYTDAVIPDRAVPRASSAIFQHLLDTYACETNKVISVWREFTVEDLLLRPHPRSSTVSEIFKHQLLSESRFFGDFLGTPEPTASQVLPEIETPQEFTERMLRLALLRLNFFAQQSESWWLGEVPFFDVERERIWIFWTRVLHTAHHRAQLMVHLSWRRACPHLAGCEGDNGGRGSNSR